MDKTCFKCGTLKPLDQFYRHGMMADGYLGKCKDCTKLDVRQRRKVNPSVREYDRARSSLPHRVELRKRIVERWSNQHPDRRNAIHAANNAVRDGKLARPAVCELCGEPKRLEKHHPDYSKPLLVVWVCKPCHSVADKLRRAVESRMEKSA